MYCVRIYNWLYWCLCSPQTGLYFSDVWDYEVSSSCFKRTCAFLQRFILRVSSTFKKIYIFKNCPEGNICGTLECLRKYAFRNLLLQKLSRRQYLRYIFEKKAKMYFIEGRFGSKVAVIFVSLFYWPTTYRAFVRGRTPLQWPVVPQAGRAKHDKHRCLYSSSTSNERTEEWVGSTLSMTYTRNIRDDV